MIITAVKLFEEWRFSELFVPVVEKRKKLGEIGEKCFLSKSS